MDRWVGGCMDRWVGGLLDRWVDRLIIMRVNCFRELIRIVLNLFYSSAAFQRSWF